MTLVQMRGKVAALTRSRTPDDPELVAAWRALKEASLIRHIRVVDAGPVRLTAEQRQRVAAILTGGDDR